ncbi:MAG: hypothetical protein DYG92_08440 [Leptolyngbya sp. PLA1]|nr:hypothetical protein [Leptolyngbya sp. PLA1]
MSSITWSMDRFYWAVIAAPGVQARGQLPAALEPLLEEHVPVETSSLLAVCTPISKTRLAVCAIPRDTLEEPLAAGALSLGPEGIPAFLSGECTAEQFNLLVGPCEPPSRVRARRRRHAALAATLATCAVLLGAGFWRRHLHWLDVAARAESAAMAEAREIRPDFTPQALHAAARLAEDFRRGWESTPPPHDAAVTLAALLLQWPASLRNSPQSLSVSGDVITVSVDVSGDPEEFLKAFHAPAGWDLAEPRLHSAGEFTRLVLEMRPVRAGALR